MNTKQDKVTRSFPRCARLLNAADYAAVFKRNKRLSDKYWTLLVRKSDSVDSRLGLAIAKKRAKRAVDRNRIKRIAREAFRNNGSSLQAKEIVIMNRDAATGASSSALRTSLDKLLDKACGL